MKRGPSEASILLQDQLCHLPKKGYVAYKEHRFNPPRRWRFDFALEDKFGVDKIGIEIDGGVWIQGRHTRGSGQVKDNEKFNEAARLGWRILRFTPQQVLKGEAITFIRKVLESQMAGIDSIA